MTAAKASRAQFLAELERQLQFANSYTRAGAVLDLVAAGHPRWPEALGEAWSICDYYPPLMKLLLNRVFRQRASLRSRIMDAAEREFFATLPPRIEVYRGCYGSNKGGFSWSMDRAVAERFPYLPRYQRTDDVLFVKLDRDEQEVVALPRHLSVTRVIRMATVPRLRAAA